MSEDKMEVWELWYPKAAAAGLSFSRSRIDPADTVLVHAAPEFLTVVIRTGDGELKAESQDLESTADTPMARLRCIEGKVVREDIWPKQEDIGRVVLLPGGEAGVLLEWWNAEDHSEWRWKIEFYNQR
jgi:hypothetical protein